MELYPAEVERLKRLVEEWFIHEERELEATFKSKVAKESTTFLAVAGRLEAKGYRALPQEDRMNILTPDNVRFTITSLGQIEAYCRSESLKDIAFEAMIKDRAGVESNLDIDEYDVRVKVRREVKLGASDPAVQKLLSRWGEVRKAFRIMRRWTFLDEANGVRFDLSMVRSTAINTKTKGYYYTNNFKDRDITKRPADFEMEVELLRPEIEDTSPEAIAAAQAKAVKNLIRGIGEILRGINKHSILIRKSVAKKALEGYTALTKSDRFRGNAPITMLVENMVKAKKKGTPNIRTGYNVTDKADGTRMMAYVDKAGELFMIDMSLNVYRTGLLRSTCENSLMDGEFVTQDREKNPISQYLIFDAYYGIGGEDVTQLPFCSAPVGTEEERRKKSRYGKMMEFVEKWNSGEGPRILPTAGVTDANKITVAAKKFLFAPAGDTIFAACARTLDTMRMYHTDGLILTPNAEPLPQKPGVKFPGQLKWKPSDENTVDFLVLFDKDMETRVDAVTTGVKGDGIAAATVQYKTGRLYVGSSADPAFNDPRGTVLFEQPLPGARERGPRRREYKPVLFNPQMLPDTMANTCYMKIEQSITGEDVVLAESGDPIEDRSIVEMRYEPKDEEGWRWIPMRVRYDKTERFQRGVLDRTLNKDESAEGVWNSIHEPVTRHMIRTGDEKPSAEELEELGGAVAALASGEVAKVYYDRRKKEKNDLQMVAGLRDLHRKFIKDKLLLGTALKGGGKSLVDLACGQGGDVWSWVEYGADFVYGTDIAGNGIRDPQDGAYRRYLNAVLKYEGYENVPRMIFTIGSSARRLATGEAGATQEEANIMRSVLGQVAPDGPVPPFVEKFGAGRLREGADVVAIMFALHYFFRNEADLNGFMTNVNDCLKTDGLFIGCCFDGQKVFDMLRRVPEGGVLKGEENGAEIWSITKRYSTDDFPSDSSSLGLPIDVKFISIGTENREYLMNFELLKQEMDKIGCSLLTKEEYTAMGLKSSTELFEDTFAWATKKGMKFPMSVKVKQYSFLNRWFIFKRRRGGRITPEEGATVAPGAGASAFDPAFLRRAEDQEVAEREAAAEALLAGLPPSPPQPGEAEVAVPPVAPKTKKELMEEAKARAKAAVATKAAAEGAAGGEGPPLPTLPVAVATGEKPKYALASILQFYIDASLQDKLKIGMPDAARWLAPSARFDIEVEGKKYPSLEHYLGAMKYKLASNKPELAEQIFAQDGTIHQEILRQEAVLSSQGARALTDVQKHDLEKKEKKMVEEESDPGAFKKYRATFDAGKWFSVKDKVLEDGLRQRFERDEKMRKILEAAKAKSLYLLYYTGTGTGSDLGGKRLSNGTIDGENKVGVLLMRFAGYRSI